jgi:PAS domain S-box-containing protein
MWEIGPVTSAIATVRSTGAPVWPAIIAGLCVLTTTLCAVALAGARRELARIRRRGLEGALAEQREVTRTITDNTSAALFLTDQRGHCTFMNPAAEEMTGYSMAEIVGAPLHERIHHHRPDGCPYPFAECPLERVLPERRELRAHRDVFFRKGGETFPVLCAARPIRGEGGAASTVLEVRDVADQVRVEREREALLESERAARAVAERATRLRDDFVATLSHELRTPLNAIQGWTGLLRRPGAQAPDKVAHGLDVIERNCHVLAELISDLLDVSRIAAGKLRLERAPVSLRETVETAVEGHRASALAKGVSLQLRLGPPGVTVLGDTGRLVQIFSNLLGNAVKFTPRNGRVDVDVTREDGRAQVVVSDTGEGIPPEHLPHLFDRFRQADSSITRRHGGLGLGLSIVRSLAELHDGEVRADSAGIGRGARFRVTLPLAAEPSRERGDDAAPGVMATGTAHLAGVRVLLVEDDTDAREIAQRILEERGATVVSVASAPEALDALCAARPDVLVSDIGLPGMDGYELVRRVHEGAHAALPAVALTAFARPEDRVRSLDAGFSLHLPKPLDPGALLAAVARLAGPAA